ncbi:hypothetical protein M3P36_07010 [Altererythrobacter sp. KTW20L]|uniref:hypothetical protein n=1 Tax=Altererythrobacter sp. KTW20L TaxID=2942210 RepID=UPI0020BF7838|nr:hypothetical protein [Altererythrobacter sp. KTW20L]MCL6250794.1 hypothetical protein [Altererythrobacter sp. KTW20L]
MSTSNKSAKSFRYFNSSPVVIRLVVLMHVRFLLQKFASVLANVHYHFNLERQLVDTTTYKTRRSAALAEWQLLLA